LFGEEQKTSKKSNNYYLKVGQPRSGGAGYAGMTVVNKTNSKIYTAITGGSTSRNNQTKNV